MQATQRVERPLHFAESVADQFCILGVYLRNYTLVEISLCFWSSHILLAVDMPERVPDTNIKFNSVYG